MLQIMKLKLNAAAKEAIKNDEPLNGVGSPDGFWYDLTDGGYFDPEDVLLDKQQIKEVNKALKLLRQLEDIYKSVVAEF